MPGALDADHPGLGYRGEPLHRLVGPQVVIQLRHERDHRLARIRPPLQMLRPAELQRRAEQDRSLDRGVVAIHQGEVGAEGPSDQPAVHQHRVLGELGELDGRGDVEPLVPRPVEAAVGHASCRRRAAGVEPKDRDVGQRREAVGRLLEDVAVHVAAVGGQRVQCDQRGDRVAFEGQGQLPDQAQAIGRMELDVATACWKDRAGPNQMCANVIHLETTLEDTLHSLLSSR